MAIHVPRATPEIAPSCQTDLKIQYPVWVGHFELPQQHIMSTEKSNLSKGATYSNIFRKWSWTSLLDCPTSGPGALQTEHSAQLKNCSCESETGDSMHLIQGWWNISFCQSIPNHTVSVVVFCQMKNKTMVLWGVCVCIQTFHEQVQTD